ncbi:MAG TPA: hypothetical protein VIL99_13630 [Ignavibacteria bacterium]
MSETEKNIKDSDDITGSSGIQNEESKTLSGALSARESNYEITLINENLLRIKILTVKAVSINCLIKDISAASGEVSDQNINHIIIHPKQDFGVQEIEIFIALSVLEKPAEETTKKHLKPGDLTPNPEVAYLIQKTPAPEPLIKTPEYILEEKLGRKNPFHLNRMLYKKNMMRAITASLILTFILVFTFYGLASKKLSDNEEEQPRMIVLQDISEPKPPENIHDPVKPEVEDKTNISDDIKQKVNLSKNSNPIKTIKRKEKPLIDTVSANLTRKLDSLEKIRNTATTQGPDTTNANKNLSSDTAYAKYATFGLILNNSECSSYWTVTQYTPDFMKPGDSILTFVKYVDNDKKEQIQLYVYNKKFKYDDYKNKFTDENKFDIGDPAYVAYKVSETDNENVTLIYYVKYKDKIEFTYYSRTNKSLLSEDSKRIIDLTVKSLKVSEKEN